MSIKYYMAPLSANDLVEIMGIERSVYWDPWPASIMRDSLLAAHNRSWGIFTEENSDLIGFGILSVVIDEAEVLSLSITEKFQNKGYGAILLKFLIGKAKQNKAEKLFLEVRASNKRAIDLYFRLNFKQIGIRKDYYPLPGNSREDAYVFELDPLV